MIQIKMNIFCLAALLLALINVASVPVMKPSYRRITLDMIGYIDVGDGCWRPNVLVTRFGCW